MYARVKKSQRFWGLFAIRCEVPTPKHRQDARILIRPFGRPRPDNIDLS
jgi:hypothetical protein